jgi:hypothetical protein
MSNFNELFYVYNRVLTSSIPLTVRSVLTVEYYVEDENYINILAYFLAGILEKENIKTYSHFCEVIQEEKNEYVSIFESYLTLSKEKREMKRKLYAIDMTLNNFMRNIKSTELNGVDNVDHNNVSDDEIDDNIKFSYIKKGTEKSKNKGSILHYMEKEKPKKTPKDYSKFTNYMNRMGYYVVDAVKLKFTVNSYTEHSKKYNIWHDSADSCFKCNCPSYYYSSQDNPGFKCKHLKKFIKVYGWVMADLGRNQ